MSRIRILPYRQGSRSAAALAQALGGRVLKLEGSRFVPRADDLIINWGSTEHRFDDLYNYPNDIRRASNKLDFFTLMREQGLQDLVPTFYTNQEDIPDEAFPIVCRTVLAGHSGAGIVIANQRNELVPARLYVQYVKKQDEYRIHLGRRGEETVVISRQRKARREGHENPNWQVRNHSNGFVFVRSGVNPPQSVETVARQVFEATGLDFGAVDVIYNARANRAYVLEINTAPGLEGTTVTDYAAFFRGLM